jgi:hypothetical protein
MEASDRLDAKSPLYVVLISGKTAGGQAVHGTGFIVSARGHVATCRHNVIPTADGTPVTELRVRLPYPAEKPYAYRILGSSAEDLAVLESIVPLDIPVPEPQLHEDWIRDTQVGDPATFWGYSSAEHYTRAQRFDCTISGFSEAHGRIGLACDINKGDSGAPVLDRRRRVIGIANARDRERVGQGMAIPVSLLCKLLHELGVPGGPALSAGTQAISQAPFLPDHPLLGRDAVLRELKLQLAGGQHVALCFKPGVGKSALATALANDSEMRERFDGGVLWASLNMAPNVLSELRKWGVALKLPLEEMERLDGLAPDAQADAAQAQRRATEQWGRALSRHIGQRRMLLVIDDAWELEPAQALLLHTPNCAHVVTTREQVKVAGMLGDRFNVIVVDELTEDDGIALLRQLAPKAVDMFPEEARKVFQAVGGLPQGLLLLGMHLRQASVDGRRRRIAEAYREVQDRLEERIKPLRGAIQISYDALPDDDSRWALQALSIFRPKPDKFTEDAALAVLQRPAAAIDVLHDAGLVETVHSGDDPHDLPYTIHRTIAEFAYKKLPPEDAEALHRRAAAHFATWLRQYEEAQHEPGSYGYQYRYENAHWQDAMDAFLFHIANSGDPTSAILDFVSIYFNAFWWWGWYSDFPFCTRLLQQAATKRLSEQARAALDLLSRFDAAYPKQTEGERAGDWAEVEAALKALRALGGLEGDVDGLAGEAASRTRALTDIFLAESLRFGRRDFAAAQALYEEALALLPDDDWSHPWVLYHIGDLALDAGRPADAHCLAARCLALADAPQPKDRDHEIIANAHRLRAEAAAQLALPEEELDGLQRAVLHVYAFQAVPGPPDTYTVAFYRQITTRVARLLQALGHRDRARARACCCALRDYWASYRTLAGRSDIGTSPQDMDAMLCDAGTDRLSAYLFPPQPAAGDMRLRGSPYFNEAIAILNEKLGSRPAPADE